MRLPRDVDGVHLAESLKKVGYRVTRQTGSHIRLTSIVKGKEHHVTIPRHSPLKVGTLAALLKDVGAYLELDRETLLERLFD